MEGWEITSFRYVGYIDIMGFKDLVFRKSSLNIYHMMLQIQNSIKSNLQIQWSEEDESNYPYITSFSDSIFIFSKDNSNASFKVFFSTMASLIEDLYRNKIPFKGSIAFGKMTVDIKNSIYFGKPLIDAYLLENEMYFYGVIIHSSVENKIKKLSSTELESSFITLYKCPLKNGIVKHYTVIPFSFIFYEIEIAEEIKNNIIALNSMTSGILRKYIENTSDFIDEIIKTMISQ